MIQDYKESLKAYIERDELYQDWKKGKLFTKHVSDFDMFCIKHCENIDLLLRENEKLEKLCNEYEEEHRTVFKMWLKEIDKYKQKEQK